MVKVDPWHDDSDELGDWDAESLYTSSSPVLELNLDDLLKEQERVQIVDTASVSVAGGPCCLPSSSRRSSGGKQQGRDFAAERHEPRA